jgi:hypothetical protein
MTIDAYGNYMTQGLARLVKAVSPLKAFEYQVTFVTGRPLASDYVRAGGKLEAYIEIERTEWNAYISQKITESRSLGGN